MADDDLKRPTSSGGDMFCHGPMPYVVEMRLTLTDDEAPRSETWRGYAYSLLEAMLQASMAVGGKGVSDERVKVIFIGPDLVTYVTDLVANTYGLREAEHARLRRD
jgi:hypothetical protein